MSCKYAQVGRGSGWAHYHFLSVLQRAQVRRSLPVKVCLMACSWCSWKRFKIAVQLSRHLSIADCWQWSKCSLQGLGWSANSQFYEDLALNFMKNCTLQVIRGSTSSMSSFKRSSTSLSGSTPLTCEFKYQDLWRKKSVSDCRFFCMASISNVGFKTLATDAEWAKSELLRQQELAESILAGRTNPSCPLDLQG